MKIASKETLWMLLPLFIAVILGIGSWLVFANKPSKDSYEALRNAAEEKHSNLIEANRIEGLIFYEIEQLEMKKVSKKQMELICTPLKHQLDSVLILLTVDEIKAHDSLADIRGKEMVDRLMIYKQQNK